MKTLKVFLGSFLVFSMLSFSALQEAPKAVRDAFSHKFPTAKSVKWSKEKNQEWEAEFKIDQIEYSANFLENGVWKETEHSIEISKVPPEMQANLNKSYPDYRIEKAEISETSAGVLYEFDLKKGKSKVEVVMDKSAKIIKKEIKKAH